MPIEDASRLVRDLSMPFYAALQPWYGWVDCYLHDFLALEDVRNWNKLDTLYSLNFFGSQYLEKYGAQIFIDAPVWKKEQLSGGGLYLQTSELHTGPMPVEEKRKLQECLQPHGITVFQGNPLYPENRWEVHRADACCE